MRVRTMTIRVPFSSSYLNPPRFLGQSKQRFDSGGVLLLQINWKQEVTPSRVSNYSKFFIYSLESLELIISSCSFTSEYPDSINASSVGWSREKHDIKTGEGISSSLICATHLLPPVRRAHDRFRRETCCWPACFLNVCLNVLLSSLEVVG